jgi:hypothetical protein
MGFLSLLTLLFIGAKLWGVIDWSWWLVLSPTIFNLAFLVAIIIFATFIPNTKFKVIKK